MTLGERIRAAREALKMTQEELGALCNTTKQTIFKYEAGVVTNIPLDRLELLSEKLGVTPAYLTGWTTDAALDLPEKLQALSEPFGELNDAGQDKVIGYTADLVSSGKYVRTEPARVIPFPKPKRRADGFVEFKVYDQPAAAGLGNYIDTPAFTVEQYPAMLAPDGAGDPQRLHGVRPSHAGGGRGRHRHLRLRRSGVLQKADRRPRRAPDAAALPQPEVRRYRGRG